MSTTLFLVSMVIITALFFDFTNGFHDSANAMACVGVSGLLGLYGLYLISQFHRGFRSIGVGNSAGAPARSIPLIPRVTG